MISIQVIKPNIFIYSLTFQLYTSQLTEGKAQSFYFWH